jgi:hypothetical protein
MSGSNSSGDRGPEVPVDCLAIMEETTLASPAPSVLSKLKVNDVLDLQFNRPLGPLVAVTQGGETAGSITSSILLISA